MSKFVISKRNRYRIIVVALSLIDFLPIRSQIADGTYIYQDQKMMINGSKTKYEFILKGHGINTIFKGSGSITIKDKKLYINPENLQTSGKSVIKQTKANKKDSIYIVITGKEPNQAVAIFYKKTKEIYSAISNDKIFKVPRKAILGCDSVWIGFVGYRSCGIKTKFDLEFDYKVELYPYTEDDLHYDFITNNEKGFNMRYSADKLMLQYESNDRQKWHKFIRNK